MTVIVGINAYHGDSAACIIVDGKLVAAAEEERFRRIKHWAGLPTEAIKYCVREAGVGADDIAYFAINSDPKANVLRKLRHSIVQMPGLSLLKDKLGEAHQRGSINDELAELFGRRTLHSELRRVEHHLAHLASAYLVSPFADAVIVSIDGFGDFASAAWGPGRGGSLRLDGKVYFPHSLGIFYMAITQHLGFPTWGDEYKVMGLAPYGKPTRLEAMRRIVKLKDDGTYELDMRFFRHHRERLQEWPGSAPHVNQIFTPALTELLGPPRRPGEPLSQDHRDIAHSAQARYEEACFHLLNTLHQRYGMDELCLAGGCAMNSVANGRVYARTPFKRLYIQSAAGDAGGAIGAAYAVLNEVKPGARFLMDHAYWGPAFTNDEIKQLLDATATQLNGAACQIKPIEDEDALCRTTAKAIAAGQVVGWFQGRMEWGPRALGNRSILGDPRRADMKDILNLKIKRRESFRPFAPSILREAVPEWFVQDDDVPFMMQVYPIREEKRPLIPAVTHVDGSGRLQTVERAANPLYYRLIEAFRDLTSVPMVLNTSFNENEPVVCQPKEALDCFLRTKMDVLVMGNWYVSRGTP